MFSLQPFYAMLAAFIYVGIVYLLVRKEKKSITYSVTALACLLQLSYLFLWLRKSVYFMTTSNVGFPAYERFLSFVESSYFVLTIPLLLLLAWYVIKKIGQQDLSFWLKTVLILIYVGALIGVLIIGQLIFIILYYGFAP